MIFILSSISSGLEFGSVNHTSMYELNEFLKNFYEKHPVIEQKANKCKTFESCW